MAGRQQRDFFRFGADKSDNLANERHQYVEFYHVPTGFSVKFKAFVTRFDDGFQSEWNEEEAFGRMDPMATFKRTRRIISLGFDVVAGSAEEAQENQEKLSLLQEMLYPTYENQQGGAATISAGPLMKLRFMNLIQNASTRGGGDARTAGLLGKVSGFNHAPDLDAGFFDVLNEEGEPVLYPQHFKLDFEYTALHQHQLGWQGNQPRSAGFGRFPYGGARNESAPSNRSRSGESTSATDRLDRALSNTILERQGE